MHRAQTCGEKGIGKYLSGCSKSQDRQTMNMEQNLTIL